MSLRKGKSDKGSAAAASAEKVVVAVKAAKEISKTAIVWALTHVVQPADCITLLVVLSSNASENGGFRDLQGTVPVITGDQIPEPL